MAAYSFPRRRRPGRGRSRTTDPRRSAPARPRPGAGRAVLIDDHLRRESEPLAARHERRVHLDLAEVVLPDGADRFERGALVGDVGVADPGRLALGQRILVAAEIAEVDGPVQRR